MIFTQNAYVIWTLCIRVELFAHILMSDIDEFETELLI